MITHGTVDIVSMIYGLKLIEKTLDIENPDLRAERFSSLEEDGQFSSLISNRFAGYSNKQELLRLLKLPLNDPERQSKLYPEDTVSFSCRVSEPDSVTSRLHILFSMSGRFQCTAEDDSFVLEEGSVCIFSQNTRRSYSPCDGKSTAISLYMNESYFHQALMDDVPSNTLLMSVIAEKFLSINRPGCWKLMDISKATLAQNMLYLGLAEYMNKSFCAEEVIRCYIKLFLLELLKSFIIEADEASLELMKNVKGSDIIKYIDDNCSDITLCSAAEHFHFHPNYFSKLIKNYTGTNFKHLVQSARLRKSCKMLRYESIPISQIALSIGYKDTSNFYALFKSTYGVTPAQYRQQLNVSP